MLKALIAKELRETIGFAVVALLVYAYFVASAMGVDLGGWQFGRGEPIPFVGEDFLFTYLSVAVGLALALGARQTLLESIQGTHLFLLHRPARREWLIGSKLLTGLGLYLICSAAPILIYAWWAATPGTHASPFEWSMTFYAWRAYLVISALYLAAFLCGIRPARWYGTRLVPLIGVGFVAFAIAFLPHWWIWGIVALGVLNAVLLTAILFVARTRDF